MSKMPAGSAPTLGELDTCSWAGLTRDRCSCARSAPNGTSVTSTCWRSPTNSADSPWTNPTRTKKTSKYLSSHVEMAAVRGPASEARLAEPSAVDSSSQVVHCYISHAVDSKAIQSRPHRFPRVVPAVGFCFSRHSNRAHSQHSRPVTRGAEHHRFHHGAAFSFPIHFSSPPSRADDGPPLRRRPHRRGHRAERNNPDLRRL